MRAAGVDLSRRAQSTAAAYEQREQQDAADHEDHLCGTGQVRTGQPGAAKQACQHGDHDQYRRLDAHLHLSRQWLNAARIGGVPAYQSDPGPGRLAFIALCCVSVDRTERQR